MTCPYSGGRSIFYDFTFHPLLIVIGIVFFAKVPTPWTLGGAGIVIARTLYTLHRNALKKRTRVHGVQAQTLRLVGAYLGDHGDHPHSEEPACCRNLPADPPGPDDGQGLGRQFVAAITLPEMRGLLLARVGVILDVDQHRHHHELGQRSRVDATRRRHHDVRIVQPQSSDASPDAAAGRLKSLRLWRQISDIGCFRLRGWKVPKNVGSTKRAKPSALLFGCPAKVLTALVIRNVARRR